MSKVIFRNIEKKDLDQVFVILNQLKQIDIGSIDKDTAWSDFITIPVQILSLAYIMIKSLHMEVLLLKIR